MEGKLEQRAISHHQRFLPNNRIEKPCHLIDGQRFRQRLLQLGRIEQCRRVGCRQIFGHQEAMETANGCEFACLRRRRPTGFGERSGVLADQGCGRRSVIEERQVLIEVPRVGTDRVKRQPTLRSKR